ncbi:LuxR C-terminal-related transcriptional regulator [Mucilaginibacter sp.]|uniref:response regulator transcription factor n=1 Tax=Mucilaginibacter sp. TaxID=1882438 RepID=UPI002627EE22|nr:LuxR C-terminal-related transcriptional regulator [Mucilaginibacter sp.]MDB4919821.1 response regulator containing a CheY-like receiver domain and an DNA-binding domain [Mucilaginibacter sp.]
MTLPAGLRDNNYEFFADDNRACFITQGAVAEVDKLSEQMLQAIESELGKYPEKLKGINKMGVSGRLPVINQFMICNYGGFDSKPDLVNYQLGETEYWPCPKRGTCAFEGIVCDGLRTNTGEVLSKREIEVVKHIATGELDKNIAHNLNISHSTLTTHTRNIRRKTKLFRKADITRFAYENTLI